MPPDPTNTPNLGIPRFSNDEEADFSFDLNSVVDFLDDAVVSVSDSRLSDERVPVDGSVTTAKVAAAGLGTAAYGALSITNAKIADGTILGAKLAVRTVDNGQLANNAADSRVLAPGSVGTGQVADGSVTRAKFAADAGQTVFQPGDLKMAAYAAAPAGWLLCAGQAVQRSVYAGLFAAIGTTFGAGNGATTFNVPDLRGRVPLGVGSGGSLSARNLGDKAGEETHVLGNSEMPSHAHGVNDAGHGHLINDPGHFHAGGTSADSAVGPGENAGMVDEGVGSVKVDAGSGSWVPSSAGAWGDTTLIHSHSVLVGDSFTGIGIFPNVTGVTIQDAGGGQAHNNMQPFLGVNFFVKT